MVQSKMVATRRGVRVSSAAQTDSDSSSAAQATPATGRRTRSTAKHPESSTQTTVEEASSQKIAQKSSPPGSSRKRCTRASKLHTPDKPCTSVGSVHEDDVSDLESCCSAVSDVEAPVTHRTQRRQVNKEADVSEVESCLSAVSASRAEVRRSTRKNNIPDVSDSAGEVKDNKKTHETEPCTLGRRTRTEAKRQTEDSEASDVDSLTGAATKSSLRRSTRSRIQLEAIPLRLEKTSDSQSPATTIRRTRATRGKPAAENVSEPMSCDSDGFESGPTYSRATRSHRKKTQIKITESDSDLTDQGKGTPSSSRTGSGSSYLVQELAVSPKGLCIVLEKATVPSDEDAPFEDSKLENTVTEEDAECTLLEKEEHISSKETKQEPENPLEKPTAEEGSAVSPDGSVPEPAVTSEYQREALSAKGMADISSEMEMMQETVQPPEPPKPLQSASVTTCDSEFTENKDETMEVANVDTDVSDNNKTLDQGGDDVEMPEGDEMEARVVADLMKCSETEEKLMQGTSSQKPQIPEQPSEGAVVRSEKVASLLDSSEEEEDDDEFADDGGESLDDEVEGGLDTCGEEGQSGKSEVIKLVDGLFMVDTRPGQEADEDYYKDKAGEEEAALEEKDEEFVDEDIDDGDDEEAELLFSPRNPQFKELSSHIDPGIRMKELGGLYITFDGTKSKPVSCSQPKLNDTKIQEVMKKSVMGPEFEKKDAVPPYTESKRALKAKRRTEREKTTGDAWFNMKAPEITQELKGDLQLLKMRGSMDPKRFYKKNDRDGLPKYFQMGTVVDNPVDFYHSRVPKKERKRTMVEELLADAEFRVKNKKKFQAIMAERAAQGAGRRHKMKNKFHKKK